MGEEKAGGEGDGEGKGEEEKGMKSWDTRIASR